MKTSAERIQKDIETLAQFQSVPGRGCNRFSYTPAFRQAADYLAGEMKKAGLTVRENAVGAVIGILPGQQPKLAPIVVGSHFDSVPEGGNFDGIAGICAALEVARVFHAEGYRPQRSYCCIAIPEEEGPQFSSGLFGSRAMCGQLYPDEIHRFYNAQGQSIAQVLQAYGKDPSRIATETLQQGDWAAFLELHIEQGPVLDREKLSLGIVEAIVGLKYFMVTVKGVANHSGATPMTMRADTVLAMSRAVVAATDKALQLNDGTVFTTGSIEVQPGAGNIIPGQTVFSIDCRSRHMESIDAVMQTLQQSLEQSKEQNPGLSYAIEERLHADPVEMDETLQTILEQQAQALQIPSKRMCSGAGHDTMIFHNLMPTAMLFVPSRNGRSHVPEEWTDYDQIQQGTEVLYRTLRKLTAK